MLSISFLWFNDLICLKKAVCVSELLGGRIVFFVIWYCTGTKLTSNTLFIHLSNKRVEKTPACCQSFLKAITIYMKLISIILKLPKNLCQWKKSFHKVQRDTWFLHVAFSWKKWRKLKVLSKSVAYEWYKGQFVYFSYIKWAYILWSHFPLKGSFCTHKLTLMRNCKLSFKIVCYKFTSVMLSYRLNGWPSYVSEL